MRVLLAALLLAVPALAAAEGADAELPKKDRERATKAPRKRPLPAVGKKPPKLVNLYNSWTHEWLAVTPGEQPARPTIDRFLRDHYTNTPTAMDKRLIDIVVGAAAHFDSDRVLIVSAFRSPKYNLMLRKKGRQVARDSQHTKGTAIDFQLPNVFVRHLHAWAKNQAIGGVGIYLDSGFVHMDTGPVRFWSGE